MEKKYELTNEVSVIKRGELTTVLHRIKALKDFDNVKKGDLGGFIESEENLSQEGDCWVYGNAKVYNCAEVYNDAKIYGNAEVCDYAEVYDSARVHDSAYVFGFSSIYGKAIIFEHAIVHGNAEVYDKAKVHGHIDISGNANICENANVYGYGSIYDNAKVYGNATVSGTSEVHDNAKVFDNATICDSDISDKVLIFGKANISDSQVEGNACIYDDAKVSNDCRIYGSADISGNADISYSVINGHVGENSVIIGTYISGNVYNVKLSYAKTTLEQTIIRGYEDIIPELTCVNQFVTVGPITLPIKLGNIYITVYDYDGDIYTVVPFDRISNHIVLKNDDISSLSSALGKENESTLEEVIQFINSAKELLKYKMNQIRKED